jgi:hypothetical protein
MISEAQLQSLDFEYDEDCNSWNYKDITVFINITKDLYGKSEITVDLSDFELYGIRDVRDLRKLIELVYGK